MESSAEETIALANQISQLANNVVSARDPMSRKQQTAELVMQAKQLIWQVQDPFDAIMDHIVNGYTIATCLACSKLGVFEAIPPTGTATAKEVAEKCDAPEELIIRLMRQLTCVNIFNEVQLGVWAHNRLSIMHSEHAGAMSGKWLYSVSLDEMAPSMYRLNHYLNRFGTHTILDTYTETPHSWYYNMVGKSFWEVLNSSPGRLENFIRGLGLFDALHPVLAMYPFEDALRPGNSPDRPLMVDIGGGRGLALLEIRKGCPSLQGELILQDRSCVLDDISPKDLPGVTKMPHNFFEEQPVKNAQMYYIRRVLHDWQDKDAVRILRAIIPAMAEDSRIIISDMAIPEPVTLRDAGAIWLDLMMMSIGGKERTVDDWAKLGEMSGLTLVGVYQDTERLGPLCVVEYVLPENNDKQHENGKTSADGSSNQTEMDTPRLPIYEPCEPDETELEPLEPRDVDWEERTVFGDREQSLGPNQA
ncbi:O-methyltransferase desB [Exophiala dermatitidis]